MYAVIKSGGKQERVEEGQTLSVEMLGLAEGEDVQFAPILLVDGGTVLSRPDELREATVSARVIGASAGPKIKGLKYKPKARSRRHWGHRQHYSVIEIIGISRSGGGLAPS